MRLSFIRRREKNIVQHMAAGKSINGNAIVQKINMQTENVIIIKNATNLNAFGMDTIVMMFNHFQLIISINELVIIKGIGSNLETLVEDLI